MLSRAQFVAASAALVGVPTAIWADEGSVSDVAFAPAAVRADLDAIWDAIGDVGAEPFRAAKRADVERCYRRARAAIVAPCSPRQAWLAIAPVLGALNDGHVALGFAEPLNSQVKRFPLRFALADDDGLLVARSRGNVIPAGSRLVAIDDVPAQRIRDVIFTSFGGQTPLMHRIRVGGAGAWGAYALLGGGPVYRVRWAASDGSGAVRETDVAANSMPATGGPSPVPTTTPPARQSDDPYTYRTLQDGTVGVIDYRRCEDLPRFTGFLDATFSAMQSAPPRALIVDIRGNGGGNSRLNDVLWTYVSDKPFKQYGGVMIRACDRLKREYGREKYVEIYGDAAWNAPNGTLLTFGADPNSDLVEPKPLAVRYRGPVYLLISAYTFSSAMQCALAAKDYGLATIVGEETGEPVSSTGEVYTMRAPATDLRAYLTTKVFLPPKPHPQGEGVLPDVPVPVSLADTAAGRDPVLERTLALIGTVR